MPKKISLISKNLGNDQATSYQDKERVEFTELEKRNFQCYIREVYPEPRVRILLGREDITDRFNKSLRLTRTISDEGIVSIGELSALHYDVIMTSYGLEFTYEFDNNSISCLADFPGGGFSTSSATVHVVLKGCELLLLLMLLCFNIVDKFAAMLLEFNQLLSIVRHSEVHLQPRLPCTPPSLQLPTPLQGPRSSQGFECQGPLDEAHLWQHERLSRRETWIL